ncbi:hypothetical protein RBU61_17280 [Tissierella sp. MB52-C2]|nr:hypothetical protein [Tissierella sp. MB52-C2]WMM24658.1 hypothetical protein RBU61_17280 [Tissierella sp. MB52-C2]
MHNKSTKHIKICRRMSKINGLTGFFMNDMLMLATIYDSDTE